MSNKNWPPNKISLLLKVQEKTERRPRVPRLDFTYLQLELAGKSSAVLESRQRIINTAKLCLRALANTFLPRVKISVHGGKHQDVVLSPLTSKEAFLLISVEPEFLLRRPAAMAREYFLLS